MTYTKQRAYIYQQLIKHINCNNHLQFISNCDKIDQYINKAKILNLPLIQEYNIVAITINDVIKVISSEQLTLPRYSDEIFKETEFKSIDLTNVDTSKVTSMVSIFELCEAKYINLGNINTSKTKNMMSMFKNAKATVIDGIEHMDTSNVENMASMFRGIRIDCLDLSNFNTSKVESMREIFWNSKIKTLDISSFTSERLISAMFMFGCSEIGTLILRNGLDERLIKPSHFLESSIKIIESDREIVRKIRKLSP